MITLKHIETTFKINYPPLYRQLFETQMLDWGSFGKDWINKVFPELCKRPPLLLFAKEFIMMDFERIEEEIEAFKDPDDYKQTHPKFNFIPFAQNKAGDLYCFQFDAKTADDIPIVLVWHDMNLVQTLAKNLQDFIFRAVLESLLREDVEDTLLARGDCLQHLKNYQASHLPFLSTTQQSLVSKWFNQAIQHKKTNAWLSSQEMEAVQAEIITHIQFPNLGLEFKYQNQ